MSSPLDLTVQNPAEVAEIPSEAQIRRWMEGALALPGLFTVRFVTEAEGAELNGQYRKKTYATNVLTFPYACDETCEADLVICPAVVSREATEQKKPLMAHYAHLIVHGTLHAQGYDHETDEAAEEMEAEERAILAELGFADPYRVED